MIGIIPAAGSATRMGGIPKMLLPIPPEGLTLIDVLAARMQMGGSRDYPIIVSNGAIAKLLSKHTGQIIDIAQTDTMSETVLSSKRYFNETILFGMPDTYFDDDQAFVKLKAALEDGADVAVGLFLTRQKQRSKLGMCDFDTSTQQIIAVIDKPELTTLTWAWGVLAWKPEFWQYIRAEDPHVGYALPRAIEAGLDVRAVRMGGEYFDCGTPDEYFECIEHLRRPG